MPLLKRTAPSSLQAKSSTEENKRAKYTPSAGLNKAFKMPIPGMIIDENTIQVLEFCDVL
jgi:hypothetical protein